MKREKWIGVGAAVVILCAFSILGYQRWTRENEATRGDLLALMPTDASAVVFADFAELRHAPFVAELYAWAPKPQVDADYAQFLKATGFDYERDLQLVAIATEKRGNGSVLFAIVDGKFTQEKIVAYAAKYGTSAKNGGRDIFSVPIGGSSKKISFTFLSKSRMALTDDADLAPFLNAKKSGGDDAEWRTRFERLAGSPVFAVIRQGAEAGAALAQQAPGGLRSPQLSSLLNQLQWVTIAGKPDNNSLRVIADGECASDGAVRQLVDMLNGVIILAEAGLSDPKTRQQMDPAVREAYLELLKGADVSKIDRGDTKSVRLIFELTPKILEAARTAAPLAPHEEVPAQQQPPKVSTQKKGRT